MCRLAARTLRLNYKMFYLHYCCNFILIFYCFFDDYKLGGEHGVKDSARISLVLLKTVHKCYYFFAICEQFAEGKTI